MKRFLDEDFLLSNDTAKRLFHEYAENMPIVDYHCHINPADIANDISYKTITDAWLGGDFYKWTAMRSNGIPEKFVTGDAEPAEKFLKWAETIPNLIGNPLYHWTHLELQRYFGINEPLSGENAGSIYDACNRILASPSMSARGILEKSNVRLICTTDDPTDDLGSHKKIAADNTFKVTVLPTFRPDRILNLDRDGFSGYLKRFEKLCGHGINKMEQLRDALDKRINYFAEHGCVVSDHGLDHFVYREASEETLNTILRKAKHKERLTEQEIEEYQTAVLLAVAKEYHDRGWVMQIHFGCMRNISDKMMEKLGADSGFDSINDAPSAKKLAGFLNALEKSESLPKMILYSLNSKDYQTINSIMGNFQTDSIGMGRIQSGSAWWFNDHKPGIEKQLSDLANMGVLGSFIGMLTDSRSFLSFARHEYFRRILCNYLGGLVENGEYPNDMKTLGKIVENICYHNTVKYFGFEPGGQV